MVTLIVGLILAILLLFLSLSESIKWARLPVWGLLMIKSHNKMLTSYNLSCIAAIKAKIANLVQTPILQLYGIGFTHKELRSINNSFG